MSPAQVAAPNDLSPFSTPGARGQRARQRTSTLIRVADACLMIGVFLSGDAVLRLGGLNLTFSDVFLFAAAALYLGQRRFNMAPFGAMTPIWILGLSTMLGGLFVSSAINGDLLRWLDIGTQYAAAYYLVPVLLMTVDKRFAQRLVVIYMLGIVCAEIFGILAFFFLTPAQTSILGPDFLTGTGRLGGMAAEANSNGATIAYALAMLLYAVRKELIGLKLVIPCAGILIWALLLTASATGLISCTICLCASLAITSFTRLLKIGLVVAIAIGLYLGSGGPLPQTFQKRVGDAVVNQDVTEAGTFVARTELIEEAWGQAGKHLLLGMGADEYRTQSQYGQPVHNLHLLIWDEGGAPAYLGLLMMLGLIGIFALAAIPESREEAALALAVVIVYYIYTMALPHLYSRFYSVPIFVALSPIYGRGTLNAVKRYIPGRDPQRAYAR